MHFSGMVIDLEGYSDENKHTEALFSMLFFPPHNFFRKSRHFFVLHFLSHIHYGATGLFGLQVAQKPFLNMSLLKDIQSLELIWHLFWM